MTGIVHFLEQHSDEFINYWISSYYVESKEYQMRKDTPGFLDAQYREASQLFSQALKKYGTEEVTASMKDIGEDRRDMNTPWKDIYLSHFSFYTALTEFIVVHYKKHTLDCPLDEFLDSLIELRRIEALSSSELYDGYEYEANQKVLNR
ncbi:hypothetical protein MFLO_06797 [Listeria floridensis FSL S10-1187]|uniref:Uncharacterized protein n=1 Tax=Listeria floridensis FSL S10-1187 TaxID=1265817 RepID=A0ABP3AYN8_9LIST|nr:hypothetical protein [Listeria floridensis]EUJ32415.1 hypothetical protein MFLO_06797 [Listeria floridensis FSL S10-1187]